MLYMPQSENAYSLSEFFANFLIFWGSELSKNFFWTFKYFLFFLHITLLGVWTQSVEKNTIFLTLHFGKPLKKLKISMEFSILFKTHPPHPLLWNYFHHFHSMTKTPVDTVPWGSTPQCLMGALTACRGVTKSLRGANSPLGGLEVGAWENWQNGRHYQHGQNKVEFSPYGFAPPPPRSEKYFLIFYLICSETRLFLRSLWKKCIFTIENSKKLRKND